VDTNCQKIGIENIDSIVNQKPAKSTERIKKLRGSIIGMVFFGLSYFLVQQFFSNLLHLIKQ
jgi:hypothetical protein